MTPTDPKVTDVEVTTKGSSPVTTAEIVPVRSLFKTKTAVAQYVMGVLVVWPDGAAWVSAHVQAVMAGFIVLNLAVRMFSHGKVSLIADAPDGGL